MTRTWRTATSAPPPRRPTSWPAGWRPPKASWWATRSGANLWGVREVAREIGTGVVVTILCDGGDRYLSTGLYGLTPP